MDLETLDKSVGAVRRRPRKYVPLVVILVILVALTAWLTSFCSEKGRQAAGPPDNEDKASETQDEAATREDLAEHQQSMEREIDELKERIGPPLQAMYPHGYVLFYSDGRSTIHRGYKMPGLIFDPATVELVSLSPEELCVNMIVRAGNTNLTLKDTCLSRAEGADGSIYVGGLYELVFHPVASLGGQSWVLAMRPVERQQQ